LGLFLNEDKCEVSVLGVQGSAAGDAIVPILAEAPTIKVFGAREAVLLGAPISDEAIDGILKIKTAALETFARRLKCVTAHSEFFSSVPLFPFLASFTFFDVPHVETVGVAEWI